eukprot:SAG31_NODE_336_length_17493_cov_20.694032_5_plen_33_part_00
MATGLDAYRSYQWEQKIEAHNRSHIEFGVRSQ